MYCELKRKKDMTLICKEFTLKSKNTKFENIEITSSEDSYNFIKRFYTGDIDIYESFFILLLNRANKTIGYAKISQGGIVGTCVDIKIIAKYCVDALASSVILAHNHPSGNLKPSQADISITKRIKEALSLLEVQVLDHIILTENGHYSLQNEGLI